MPTYPAGVRYIKIAKIDKDGVDQTNVLQSLTEITIPFSTGNITYNVISISEKPSFFLYSVPYTNVEFADRADLKYNFTGSITTSNVSMDNALNTTVGVVPIVSAETDPLNFYNSTTQEVALNTYPQKDLHLILTGSYTNLSSGQQKIELYVNETPFANTINHPLAGGMHLIDSQTFNPGVGQNLNLRSSYTSSIPDTKFIIRGTTVGFGATEGQFTSSQFFITSSDAVGPNVETIPEPYFGSNDFFRDTDCQPLYNNVDINRRHNQFMDVDYSAGITEPTNFELLINGRALRAEVQISNYTTRRHVIPRYEGSKSTSQKLNTFTKGDQGTYGKLPTVESLKRMVAYSDDTSGGIGGWPPERMNASAIFVRYLIDEDGDIKVPNTTPNSLEDIQGTFQTGERVLISSRKPGSGEEISYRKIIKGGARIEPILYTQIGKQPGALWTSSINLEDIQITSGSATNNYQNNGSIGEQGAPRTRDRLILQSSIFNNSLMGDDGSATGITTTYGYYKITSGVLTENVTLNFNINQLDLAHLNPGPGGFGDSNGIFQLGIILKRNNDTIGLHQENISFNLTAFTVLASFSVSNISFQVPATDLSVDDQISFEIVADYISGDAVTAVAIGGGSYSITQTPLPTLPILTGNNAIWGYFNKATNPSVITSSNAVSESLAVLYGDPNVRQKDIDNSGFNTVSLPWSIKTGDEFRFEGEEKSTYMVKRAYGPNESGGDRLSQTGSIEVHFDKNLPISASITNFNLDHFLIRRYVNDASQIIIEGFKPTNSEPPYIISPEYSIPELNKSIDEYITILTEKNLLS